MCLQFPHQVTALLTCSSVTWMLVCLVTFSTRMWNLFLVIKTTHPPVLLPIISSGSSGKNRVGTSFTHSPQGPTLGFPPQSLTTSIHRISIPLTSLYSLLTPSSNYTLPLLQCLHIKDSPPSTHVLSLFISGFTIKPVNLYCCFCFVSALGSTSMHWPPGPFDKYGFYIGLLCTEKFLLQSSWVKLKLYLSVTNDSNLLITLAFRNIPSHYPHNVSTFFDWMGQYRSILL